MALDAQSNWDVEMAQPLKLHLLRQKEEADARVGEGVEELKIYNCEVFRALVSLDSGTYS